MKTTWSIFILALAAVTVAGCTASTPAMSPTAQVSSPTAPAPTPAATVATPTAPASQTGSVTIKDFAFQPDVVTIARGGTVTWTNADGTTHTVTFADGESTLPQGGSASKKFDTAGSFDYHCSIHPGMHGKVVVV